MTATREPAAAPAPVLTPDVLARLGAVFADAIDYREPSGFCSDCEAEGCAGLCEPHAGDLDAADSYVALAAELRIELEEL